MTLGTGTHAWAQATQTSQPGNAATQALLQKARTLESRGHMDMAAQTWQQMLLADPNNTEALGGLARAAKISGSVALANLYLKRLRAINPNDPGIARAENAMTQEQQVQQLNKAQKLASAGGFAQAMAVYRQVFGAVPPSGNWALAYYETEAAVDDGRAHAVAGLRSLAEKYPQDARYEIALGRILTYNLRTRAEGRRLLERHSNDSAAKDAVKQSLLWDAPNPTASAEIRSYLQTHEDAPLHDALERTETQVAAQRQHATVARVAMVETISAEAGFPMEATLTERAAYSALNREQFADAETRFKALLERNPDNPRASAGMGYVRIHEQNFGDAIAYLEHATDSGATGLEETLATSRYFHFIGVAGAALADNDLATAEKQYRQALEIRASGAEALQGLSRATMKVQQAVAAEAKQEQSQQAARARVQQGAVAANVAIQSAQESYDKGDDVALYRQLLELGGRASLTDDQRDHVESIWANWSVRRANALSAAGKRGEARTILNAAARSFPDNPTVMRTLASGYVRAGQSKKAVAIFKSQDMTKAPATDFEAAVGAARAAHDRKDARAWLRYGMALHPNNGTMLRVAAQYERSRWHFERAAEYYRASLAAPVAAPAQELVAKEQVVSPTIVQELVDVGAGNEADTLSYQQEQVRRTVTAASLSGVGDLYQSARPDHSGHPEGAQSGAFNGEVYGPFVAYVPPSVKPSSTLMSYSAAPVTVQASMQPGSTPQVAKNMTTSAGFNSSDTFLYRAGESCYFGNAVCAKQDAATRPTFTAGYALRVSDADHPPTGSFPLESLPPLLVP